MQRPVRPCGVESLEMIAVYPAKREGLPARLCNACSGVTRKMYEINVGDAQNKIALVLCSACANLAVVQIESGGIRRPARAVGRALR